MKTTIPRSEITENKQLSNNNNNNNVKEYYTSTITTNENNTTKLQSKRRLKAIHTEVDGKVLNEFKNIVLNKHGKLHSVIGLELEKALILYNESESNKQQQTTISKQSNSQHRGDVEIKFQQIKQKLVELVSYPEINTGSIKAVIQTVLGDVDKRTFNKYYLKVLKESKTLRTGLYGSLLDVSLFVGYKEEPSIDMSKLAPTEKENEKLI